MFEDLMSRLSQGLSLIQQGNEIVAEVRENIAAARETLAETDLVKLDAKLDQVTAESVKLSGRIQRA